MTDIDYCNGQNCPQKGICQRYTDFLFRKERKLGISYARNGVEKNCEQFKLRQFVGD